MTHNKLPFTLTLGITLFALHAGAAMAKDGASDTIICPAKISAFRLSYTAKYAPPAGWGHADAYARAKKGGVQDDLTLVVNGHRVDGRSLICNYGVSAAANDLRLASIKKTMAKDINCAAVSEFRFSCKATTK